MSTRRLDLSNYTYNFGGNIIIGLFIIILLLSSMTPKRLNLETYLISRVSYFIRNCSQGIISNLESF